MKIDDKILSSFSGELAQILTEELNAGNRIYETYSGDWPTQGCIMVFLQRPFLTPIKRTLKDIVFTNINDPHYWKAEYYDKTTNQYLCCGFGGIPNFDDM